MADAFTDFILKPSAPFAAGVVLFGVVWGFFKGVESVLSEDTKLEIAIWLVDVKPLGPKMESWRDTFAKVFDRVFGETHLTWKCFIRSALASCVAIVLTLLATFAIHNLNWYVAISIIHNGRLWFIAILLVANIIPDYISLLETRLILYFMQRSSPDHLPFFFSLDFLITSYLALVSVSYGLSTVLASTASGLSVGSLATRKVLLGAFNPSELYLSALMLNQPGVAPLWFYPAFFTSIWLWLYAGSGFLLKASRRFDLGFNWFNRHFDIEHKPFSAIGLVAGSLVAVLWWTVLLVRWAVWPRLT